MASTKIPAVKAAILAALEAAKAEEGSALAKVALSDDKEPERPEQYVWIYEATADRQWKTIKGGASQLPMMEEISVELRVFVVKGSDKTKPAEERAFAIAEAVENALRNDPDLGGVLFHQRISRLTAGPLPLVDQRRAAHVLMTVMGEARI